MEKPGEQFQELASKERGPKPKLAIQQWYSIVMGKAEMAKEDDTIILESLEKEIPSMCSVTMERTCNLECTHCIYQPEKSSKDYSDRFGLSNIIENIVRQLPTQEQHPQHESPKFLHDGRILMKWHLDVFKRIREIRPDVKIGLIDNGSYTRLLNEFRDRNIKLDWLDISIDGTEETHNKQRDPIHKRAFREAMEGLKKAREITKSPREGGKVTSLFTLTKINFRDISKVADMLFQPNPESKDGLDYIDELCITTLSPARDPNKPLELSPDFEQGDVSDFLIAWEQIKDISARYNKDRQRVFFGIYRMQDLEKLARAVGVSKFLESLKPELVQAAGGAIIFYLDGVPIRYSPLSIWPQETFLIDADGANRVAYSPQYRLEELRTGQDIKGNNISNFTVKQLDENSCYKESYENYAKHWWNFFGREHLKKEMAFIKRMREMAQRK